ncbi:MAG: Nudix family hydrolase [Candidatus Thiodiazotropha sp. (ex Monitilora ramsayi)]|nr:Nudix family hydrolase [Candidatus Thiodiazotropha sp. (ex Monitilora ramsayi)]
MPIHVAAAAILDNQGQVLISKRADHLHQGGLWEFPGGKVEAGESPREALNRELKEELDILPLAVEPLIRIRHRYDDRLVLLDFFHVTRYQGEAKGMEGQPLRWVRPSEMSAEEFPAADRPVISALCLPDLYMITGSDPNEAEVFLRRLEDALKRGVRLVQLRAHVLSNATYRHLLDSARPLCAHYQAKLLINRPTDCQDWIGAADGIHLPAHQLMAIDERPEGRGLVGASCHHRAELERASQLQLDYALLSPVLATSSHPEARVLGWDEFADRINSANLPVYALGGMQIDMLARAKQAGGQGIAAISGLWPKC